MTQREEDAEAYSSAVYDSRWSRNRICRKPGTYRKRKEPGDFASDSFFAEREIRCRNSSLSEAFGEIAGKIEGSFSKILLDAAQEMRGSGGSNLTEILEHCIQKIFICKILPELIRMKKRELRYCRHWEEDLDISTESSRYVRLNFWKQKQKNAGDNSEKNCRNKKNLPGAWESLEEFLLAVLFW